MKLPKEIRSDIEYNEDGSFDIYIQKSEPEGIRKMNWLPNEGKPSLIVLRLYLPSEQIIKGEWKNPDIIF